MTPEQKRIKIAEACGWKNIRELDDLYPDGSVACGVWWQGENPNGQDGDLIPDYFNDLNAMHEAEKVLTDGQSATYQRALETSRRFTGAAEFYTFHATATQRAEAFGRTLGLWEDGV